MRSPIANIVASDSGSHSTACRTWPTRIVCAFSYSIVETSLGISRSLCAARTALIAASSTLLWPIPRMKEVSQLRYVSHGLPTLRLTYGKVTVMSMSREVSNERSQEALSRARARIASLNGCILNWVFSVLESTLSHSVQLPRSGAHDYTTHGQRE